MWVDMVCGGHSYQWPCSASGPPSKGIGWKRGRHLEEMFVCSSLASFVVFSDSHSEYINLKSQLPACPFCSWQYELSDLTSWINSVKYHPWDLEEKEVTVNFAIWKNGSNQSSCLWGLFIINIMKAILFASLTMPFSHLWVFSCLSKGYHTDYFY